MKADADEKIARKYSVIGRVQGVGFRVFVQRAADSIGVRGWARNCADGSVEVYASGSPEQLSELEGYLWKGPRMSDVRHVNAIEAALERHIDFQIR